MLKRYQVLLNGWLGDHVKNVSQKYDISFSETIRALLCTQLIQIVAEAYPAKYKQKHTFKEVAKIVRQRAQDKMKEEEFHRFLSQIYFEARKAIEVWDQEEKKRKG